MTGNPFNVRHRIAESVVSLFSHDDYPLAHSLDYPGDPGLFGPGSPTWQVVGDISVVIGGIRALLVQAAHPEVVAGVAEHSSYENDPLGRLSRTSSYVTATAYGAMPEVEAALAVVRRAHRPVHGRSHRDRPYSASSGDGASWVHNTLVESFITAYQIFGPEQLPVTRADEFVAQQARLGAMLNATELPTTHESLSEWVDSHPDIGASPGMKETVAFLAQPPLPRMAMAPYGVLFRAAAATLPPRVAGILGVTSRRSAVSQGRALAVILRWSIGASSAWWLALTRVGATHPPGVRFRYPPPIEGGETMFDR